MRRSAVLFMIALVVLGLSAPLHAGLIGSTVSAKLYYPNLSTVFSSAGPTTVSGSVEFPAGTLAASGGVDVTDTQVIWTAAFSVTYGSGAYNGIVLTFSGAPVITNVTVNGSTTINPVSTGFSSNTVMFDLAGRSVLTGQKTILDVQTGAAAVPEPATGLLSGVLAILGVAVRRRRR